MDVDALRADTPGCRSVLHLNNAGASLPPLPVVKAVKAHLDLEMQIGGYEAARERSAEIDAVYDAVARLVGAASSEIALVENATQAWQRVFHALPLAEGDRILTHRASYASNYIAMLQRARRTGATVQVVESAADGSIDLGALERELEKGASLMALTHVPTNGGLINPAAEVGALCNRYEVPYLLDACQSAGQCGLDVERLGCDFLSATGRKYLRGPRGTGFLYVRRTWLDDGIEPPMLDLHGATLTSGSDYRMRPDARRFEDWESSVAARLGLGRAVEYALAIGLEAIEERVAALADALRDRLGTVPRVHLTDAGSRRAGLVSFYIDDLASSDLVNTLRRRGINTSLSTPSSTLLDAEARELPDLVRASVHYYNTEAELDRFAGALHEFI